MANIRQLKSGNWNVQVRLAGKPARSQTFHRRSEAETWAKTNEENVKFVHPHFVEVGLRYAEVELRGRPSRELFERGGSVYLNSFRAFRKWFSAFVTPRLLGVEAD